MSRVGGWLAAPIRGYQRWISPAFPPSCRYEPSCSAYAVQALSTRGPAMGLALTGWRLLRCAPWGRGGWDPVPPRRRTLRMTRRTAVPDTSRTLRREPSVVS
ncbi:MAG: membrane protein insertion efficiency factor YidD [Geodermatophilaceae bacterium]|nr:membrane protein insertion efficiency factor YidD [Geodermatophilaceae bacterium]MDQ3455799.1 membrane protein insertion efficiency factor YidD [Actinomycetota bacterium]